MQTLTLEEYTCRTWPALETVPYDGWLLRFANGCTNRANSVYALYRSTYDVERKIAYCEQEYTSRSLKTTFKITPVMSPPGLEAVLESAGYRAFDDSLVMTTALDGQRSADPSVRVDEALTDEWLDTYLHIQPQRANCRETFRQMFATATGQRAYASVTIGERIIAVGLVSRSRDHAGLYNMATDEAFRGNGHATAIVRTLLAHAYARGARTAFLHTTPKNEAAQRLYQNCGFTEAYRYRYRTNG